MKKYKAAIFDMDGTLLDSMAFWRNLAPEYLRSNGVIASDDLVDQLSQVNISTAVDIIVRRFDLQLSPKTVLQDFIEILADYYHNKAVFKPGVEKFLQKLQEKNIDSVVFSSTPEYLLRPALKNLHAAEYFTKGIISCDTVKYNKNSVESFHAAASVFNTASEKIMVFEDAWYAAVTAAKAGFGVTVVADKEEKRSAELRGIADFYIENSFEEFPVELFF